MKKKAEKVKPSWGFIVVVIGVIVAIVVSVVMVFANKSASNDGSLTYEIISSSEEYDNMFDQRGYYLGEDENGSGTTYVVVAAGAHSTGGYGISIKKVEIHDEGAYIYVTETKPEKDSVVTMAFTYPTAWVKFNKMPKTITVTGDNGEVFNQK